MVPEAADQVTLWLKLPVPETAAEHWLGWPVCTMEGAQETLTDVMAVDCINDVMLPPLQPAKRNVPIKRWLNTAFRPIVRPFTNRNIRGGIRGSFVYTASRCGYGRSKAFLFHK
jgi:hypothetical protein